MCIFCFIKIVYIVICFGFDEVMLFWIDDWWVKLLLWIMMIGCCFFDLLVVWLCYVFESLGLIFVKFGQVLLMCCDLLLVDFVNEFVKLQDQVLLFDLVVVIVIIEKLFGVLVDELFDEFECELIVSVLIVQVYFVKLKQGVYVGKVVVVKVLWLNMLLVIDFDFVLMCDIVMWIECMWVDGWCLKLCEVVVEFDKYLYDEFDLMCEVVNGSQLCCNFVGFDLLFVFEMFWDFLMLQVFVMECMIGVLISQVEMLCLVGVDIKKFVCEGVEIFFMQVFCDGFFYVDMYFGNIQVSFDLNMFGCYIVFDFGIVGVLFDFDKNYFVQNFFVFFKCDYYCVVMFYFELGWVLFEMCVEEFESVICVVCELYFDCVLKDILFGQVLMCLFLMLCCFNVEIQLQFVLLQKMMLNVEGFGCLFDFEFDLWKIVKLYFECWMIEQIGLCGWYEWFKVEVLQWSKMLL